MNKIYNILSILLAGTVLVACYSGQEVAPIDSPDDNATATFTPLADYSNADEGDTLWFDITMDKMVTGEVTFTPVFADATTAWTIDYEVFGGVLAPYTLSSSIGVVLFDDGMPENNETLAFELSADEDIGWSFQLNPESRLSVSSSIVDAPTTSDAVTVGVAWGDNHDDWDLYVVGEEFDYDYSAASGSDPEVSYYLSNDSYDGVYVVAMNPWAVANTVTEFAVGISMPDGTKQVSTKTVDMSSDAADVVDVEGGSYVVARITKSGTSYTVSF